MGLRLYHDEACTTPIDDTNKDTIHKAVDIGQDLVDEKPCWVKTDDTTLTYEVAKIRGEGDTDDASESGQVDVLWALDVDGAPGEYKQVLELPDGDYSEPLKIWRKVTSPNVQQAFNVTTIRHQLSWHEYAK